MKSNDYRFKAEITSQMVTQAREDNMLTLRKKKINDMLMAQRLKKSNLTSSLEVSFDDLKKSLPDVLLNEFEMYDDKIGLIISFLKEDFSALNNYNFIPNNVLMFALIKLKENTLEQDETNELYAAKNKDILYEIYKALINLLKTKNDLKVLYQVTYILINFTFSSTFIKNKLLSTAIWKRLYEISIMKNYELTTNVIWIFNHIMTEEEIVKSICSSINFDEIYLDFVSYYNNNITKNISLSELYHNLKIILNFYEFNLVYFVGKLNYLYPVLISMFQNINSELVTLTTKTSYTNADSDRTKELLYLIELLGKIFYKILAGTKERKDYINYFFGEGFIFSFINVIKVNYKLFQQTENELIKKVINILYKVIANLLAFGTEEEDVLLSKNGIILLSEEILSHISQVDIQKNIIFFISNYVIDSDRNREEIILNSTVPAFIKKLFETQILFMNIELLIEIIYLIKNSFYTEDVEIRTNITEKFYPILIQIVNQDFCKSNEQALSLVVGILINIINFLREKEKLSLLKGVMKTIETSGFKDKLEKLLLDSTSEKLVSELERLKSLLY